ncbi:MAG: DUF6778 family protein [Pseudomonadota bacterium]
MSKSVIAAVLAMVLLAGCAGRFETDYPTAAPSDVVATWALGNVRVALPQDLDVNEANTFAPRGDIVWHGDPTTGDRRAQVESIVEDGVRKGASGLSGTDPVSIGVTVMRFHAVTPRAVNSAPGAVHNVVFSAQVFDSTGAPLTAPTVIQADLEAFVGSAAVVAAQEGQTQRVRITDHIAAVTAAWLGIGPDVRRSFRSWGR